MMIPSWSIPGSIVVVGALAASGAIFGGGRAGPILVLPTPSPPPAVAQVPAPTPPASVLSATGRVVDAAGRPVAGASVLIREWSSERANDGPASDEKWARLMRGELVRDILGQTRTDADGRFQLTRIEAPAFTNRPNHDTSTWPYDIVVLAPGYGVVFDHLTPAKQRSPLTLTLPGEQWIEGRVTEPGGPALAGATISVVSVGRIGEDDEHGQKTVGMLNLSWSSVPLVATTDANGRFTLRGVPPETQVHLAIRATGHAPVYLYYATTNEQPAPLIETTFRNSLRTDTMIPIQVGSLGVELKPTNHRLNGRVLFEDGGQPAAGVEVFRNQQRLGATDAAGRFAIEDLPAGPFELHISAFNTPAAALATRVEVPAAPLVIERTFQLPRGFTIAGQVVEAGTLRGVEGAEVRYNARIGPDEVWSFFSNEARTDADGRYHLVVPVGQGEVELFRLPPVYPPIPGRIVGQPVEPRFARPVVGTTGATVDASFALEPAPALVFRTVDGYMQPMVGAEARFMRGFDFSKVVGQTDSAGLIRLTGLDTKRGTTVDFIQPVRKLGARLVIPPNTLKPTREISFSNLASVTSRVLDEAGQPLAGVNVVLYSSVDYPERSGMPVGETRTDPLGGFQFDQLIVGVEYQVQLKLDGYADAASPHFLVKPWVKPVLAEFRLPATVQTLDGTVVDPRGNRLAGITVAVQRDFNSPYAPAGHSFEETDGRGEFHLNGLPGGELEVMAYRKPEGADRSIKNLIKVKVRAGSKDVRIVLPDPNARLQGIED